MKIKTIAVAMLIALMSSCSESTPTKETDNHEGDSKDQTSQSKESNSSKKEEGTNDSNKKSVGVGPITSLELGEIDDALVETGKEIYKANCTACHKIGKRSVGPALKGVTERRTPEWVMNMILNPEEMVEKDPVAKALLAEFLAPMANQSLTEDEARAILEFLRTKN